MRATTDKTRGLVSLRPLVAALALTCAGALTLLRASFGARRLAPPTTASLPADHPLRATSILVVADARAQALYAANIASVRCLCDLRNYSLLVTGGEDVRECGHVRDILFRKHCVSRSVLVHHPEVRLLMVLDGDTAVINPLDHAVEEYAPNPQRDAVFYLRFHNHEVMAGNYLVRNTAWARAFLQDWFTIGAEPADGQHRRGFSGLNQDNGALHWLLLHRLAGGGGGRCKEEAASRGWEAYPAFVACVHRALSASGCRGGDWDRIGVLAHGKGWAYDGWIVRHRWSNSTFMHHAMKNPPIGGGNEGRLMPGDGRCPPFPDRLSDPYYVSEGDLHALLDEKQERALENRIAHGFDPSSCVLRHGS